VKPDQIEGHWKQFEGYAKEQRSTLTDESTADLERAQKRAISPMRRRDMQHIKE